MILPQRLNTNRHGAVLPINGLEIGFDLCCGIGDRSWFDDGGAPRPGAAADAAALAGCRTINGTAGNNVPNAIAMAQSERSNSVLNNVITSARVTSVQAGMYAHNSTAMTFEGVLNQPPGANQNYGLMQVSIMTQQPTYFGNIMGIASMNVGVTATAVHRPRDIAIVLDFSGSMGYATQFQISGIWDRYGTAQPDPAFPQFGPWSIFAGPGMVLDPTIWLSAKHIMPPTFRPHRCSVSSRSRITVVNTTDPITSRPIPPMDRRS